MKHYKGANFQAKKIAYYSYFLSTLYASEFYEDTIMKEGTYIRKDKTRWSNKLNCLYWIMFKDVKIKENMSC